MIGALRLGLSLIVMISHLVPGWWPAASWAVFAFYTLSGYLITLIWIERYQGNWRGFWVARLLRIYPAYLAVLLCTMAVLWIWGCHNPVLCSYMGHPDLGQWFLIVRNGTPRTVPQAWAITTEIFWWGAISLGLSASRSRAWLWLLAATPAFAVAYPTGPYWFTVLGGATPFGLGAVAYWQGLKLPKDTGWMSELSYPIFIAHFGVGAMMIPVSHGWPLFFAALPPTLALSWVLVVAVERPVQKFRSSLRGKSNVSL